jgi:hypothetical protein
MCRRFWVRFAVNLDLAGPVKIVFDEPVASRSLRDSFRREFAGGIVGIAAPSRSVAFPFDTGQLAC